MEAARGSVDPIYTLALEQYSEAKETVTKSNVRWSSLDTGSFLTQMKTD